MANLSYRKAGLVLGKTRTNASDRQIRDLQRDLRCLGYLDRGIDGNFGGATERAVRALQFDLLNNHGKSNGTDGAAPISVLDYNRSRVVAITGEADQGLAGCIADMLDDATFAKLPQVQDPVAENRRIVAEIAAMLSTNVPIPFLVAILRQESSLKHFNEPRSGDEDTFIVIGLDTNSTDKHIITSRGYGAGQYTLFHHPPSRKEVSDFMLDVAKNLQKAVRELREKFDKFVNGPTSGTRADDRQPEYGNGTLRFCKYGAGDPLYMKDCAACAKQAGTQDIKAGITPMYAGSKNTYQPTRYYKTASYQGVPIRKNFPCDWPYAVRRYNGAGINSYHYQAKILQNLSSK